MKKFIVAGMVVWLVGCASTDTGMFSGGGANNTHTQDLSPGNATVSDPFLYSGS